jgi:hypothetical protein
VYTITSLGVPEKSQVCHEVFINVNVFEDHRLGAITINPQQFDELSELASSSKYKLNYLSFHLTEFKLRNHSYVI